MRRPLSLVLGASAVAAVVAGCGGGSPASTTAAGYGASAAPAAAVGAKVATRTTRLGRVLVDGRGRTLYLFEKDKGTASACDGACASVWPPVTIRAGKGRAGTGVRAARLGTTRRDDGRTELTYAGHPLYTYAGDTRVGDVKGQALDQFGAEWYVLTPSGRKIDDDS
jgi:predicted lipoprotein with Yx(FWY)xxD motif